MLTFFFFLVDKLIFNQVSLLSHTSNPKFKFIHGDVRNEVLLEKLCDESDLDWQKFLYACIKRVS